MTAPPHFVCIVRRMLPIRHINRTSHFHRKHKHLEHTTQNTSLDLQPASNQRGGKTLITSIKFAALRIEEFQQDIAIKQELLLLVLFFLVSHHVQKVGLLYFIAPNTNCRNSGTVGCVTTYASSKGLGVATLVTKTINGCTI